MNPDLRQGSMALWNEIFIRILGCKTTDISLLDLCCGRMANTGQFQYKRSLHVDVIDFAERPKNYNFIKQDVLKLDPVLVGLFDVVLCSDGIEHLSKEQGIELLKQMQVLSRKQIVFTPLGDYMVDQNTTNPEHHRSGWLVSDFPPDWETQEFPNWHPTLGIGALWAWHTNK